MEHVAIDLGSRESQICVRTADEEIVDERRCATRSLAEYLKGRPKSRVILETSAEAFTVADAALAGGHEVRVVPATLARSLNVGARGIKTDRRDARALSAVSCKVDLPSVHIPSAQARAWRAICGSRDSLVAVRTKLVNTVRSWMRGRLSSVRRGGTESFASRAREKLTYELGEVPAHIERLLLSLDAVNEQVKLADKEVRRIARENDLLRRLMSVPGIGPVTALRFVSAVDDVTRFKTAHEVQSYFGLTPGENSSADRVRRTRLTKAGSPQVRWVLVQAAWCAIRTRPRCRMVVWAENVAARRGAAIAAVALARKLAGILFAIWRDGTSYEPFRTAEAQLP